jgi:hypothetical protein
LNSFGEINEANERLWHNSYDILLLEENFSKENTIELSKMSYAMSRPSIILCNNYKFIWYQFWKYLSSFTNKFTTSKKLIYFITNNNLIPEFIPQISEKHNLFNKVTSEIHNL